MDELKIIRGALISCPENAKTANIPDSVTELSRAAFKGCTALEQVSLPGSLRKISAQAFYGCCSLKALHIPRQTAIIDSGCFSQCSNLLSILLPPETDTFGFSMFTGCHSLKSVKIPEGAEEIDVQFFDGCTDLQSVFLPRSVTRIHPDAFHTCRSLTRLAIPGIEKKRLPKSLRIPSLATDLMMQDPPSAEVLQMSRNDAADISLFAMERRDYAVIYRLISLELIPDTAVDALIDAAQHGRHLEITSALAEYRASHNCSSFYTLD